jgi:hypothetical protein
VWRQVATLNETSKVNRGAGKIGPQQTPSNSSGIALAKRRGAGWFVPETCCWQLKKSHSDCAAHHRPWVLSQADAQHLSGAEARKENRARSYPMIQGRQSRHALRQKETAEASLPRRPVKPVAVRRQPR